MNNDNRGLRTIAIAALLVAVVGISVAFAALSQSLTINATGKIKGSEWSLIWSAASGSEVTGSSATTTAGSVSGIDTPTLAISGIVLEQPGDKVEWVVTAKNDGDIDAKLGSFIELFSKTVTFDEEEGSGLTDEDVLVTLTKYTTGAIVAGDELLADDTQQYLLTIQFDPNAAEVPTHDVSISIQAIFPWIQR